MKEHIQKIFNPLAIYFYPDSPFGEKVYVVVVEQSNGIGKMVADLYKQIGDEVPLIVVTKDEWDNLSRSLAQKGERIL